VDESSGSSRAISHERRRAQIVQRLLAYEPVGIAELVELGYELDAWHLGVIATGAEAEKQARHLEAGLGAELLSVPHGAQTVWTWFGTRRRITIADIGRVLLAHEPATVSLAVGEPARGVEGWRLTHREAEMALLVARHRPPGLTRYLDVALEASALRDEELADTLIEGYLSPLDDERGGGPARRRTLRAIFDAEHNVSSAASMLKVDRRTVHRWLGEIERRLGYRLHERQAEIEIALRLEQLRGDHPHRSSSAHLD
jgi:sugar diacid utilization regulator